MGLHIEPDIITMATKNQYLSRNITELISYDQGCSRKKNQMIYAPSRKAQSRG